MRSYTTSIWRTKSYASFSPRTRFSAISLRHEVFREGKSLLVRDPEGLSRFRLESSREYLDTIPLRRTFVEAFFRRVRRNGFSRQAAHR